MKQFLIRIIIFYKRYISYYNLPACRFTPTCSEYAIDAIKKRGPIYGSVKAIKRLLRCNPFTRGGYDPI